MQFPKDFLWGAATASYQIEGAAQEDGRGESIWDRFSHTPGKVVGGHTGDVACDHYHRYRDDVQLMREIGLQAYRFSVSWPRIFPQGTGAVNEKGLDFYDRLVDALREANIEPFLTLYHWDLPQALQDQGGWTNPAIVQWFADYAGVVAQRLGDRVKYWTTHNEPEVVAFVGNLYGDHAPGNRDAATALKVVHYLYLAHGAAVPVIRQHVPDAKVGIVISIWDRTPYTDSAADQQALRYNLAAGRYWMLQPIFQGSYPEDGITVWGAALEGINLAEIEKACVPLDFYGLNYYSREVIKAPSDDTYFPSVSVRLPDVPRTFMDWEVYPEGVYDILKDISSRYTLPDIYITENGAAYDDPAPQNGVVHDPERVDYLEKHLAQISRAIQDGVQVKGYFLWSLLDNFEWAYGYAKRFGIIHVDYETQQRTLKQSALFYRDFIRSHC